MEEIVIKKASSDDWPAIVELIRLYPDVLVQNTLPHPDEFFVAVTEGEVVGCCALAVYTKRLAEIRSLAVSHAYRGMSISKQLINACVESAKAQGVQEVMAITSATELFEKQGFSPFKSEKTALFKSVAHD